MASLSGRVALVTGASAGIGAALAEMLCAEGARCALAARRGDELHAFAARRGGGTAIPSAI